MIFGFAITSVSVTPLYAQASHQSEQASQLLFGERLIILQKQKNNWLYIQCEWDGYEGWIKAGHVLRITEKEYKKPLIAVSASFQDKILMDDGQFVLSPGSSLFRLHGRKLPWNISLLFKGKKIPCKTIPFDSELFIHYCKLFYGSPYLWGGRNIMGIDCSGFTQIIFKLFNYRLPRDASLQAQVGENVDFLQEAKCGDLAFFDNEEGVISHVGILLNNHTIIHATESTGRVVIDAIDNNGVISKQLKMRTHQLRLIKRYFIK